MISHKEKLIAKLVYWAAGARETELRAVLWASEEPSFTLPSLEWSRRWKALARLLEARNHELERKLREARADAKMAQEDAKRMKARWLKLFEKNPVDISNTSH